LCVDRDSDITIKGEVKTPVIGRQENLDAAVALALQDPEEPDANAIFEAVRVYDDLQKENASNETFQIATISGSQFGGVGADRKIVAELSELLGSFPANEVILVTDGYSDEAVLPLVESRVPVSSVRRIVVKHSERIEESAALFFRYLKMIMQNPRYSRIALGVPGLLILIVGILSFFNLLYVYWMVLLFFFSAILLIKGFGVDTAAKGSYKWLKEYEAPPLRVQISSFAAGAGALCIIVGFYLGTTRIPPISDGGWFGSMPLIIGRFIEGSMDLVTVGICVALLGRAIRWYMERDSRLLRNVALMIIIAWSRQILDGTSQILINPQTRYDTLIIYIGIGILIGITSVVVIIAVQRGNKGFFKQTERRVEEFGEG
jgi:putative membrane protein